MFRHLDYKNCLFNNEVILKSQQRFKSEAHNIYTEEDNKIPISCNNDNATDNDTDNDIDTDL